MADKLNINGVRPAFYNWEEDRYSTVGPSGPTAEDPSMISFFSFLYRLISSSSLAVRAWMFGAAVSEIAEDAVDVLEGVGSVSRRLLIDSVLNSIRYLGEVYLLILEAARGIRTGIHPGDLVRQLLVLGLGAVDPGEEAARRLVEPRHDIGVAVPQVLGAERRERPVPERLLVRDPEVIGERREREVARVGRVARVGLGQVQVVSHGVPFSSTSATLLS